MIITCFLNYLILGILVIFSPPANGSFNAAVNNTLMNLEYNCLLRRKMFLHGGRDVDWRASPWVALLYLPDDLNQCRCGATLVTPRFVLTAAHCLEMCPRRNELRVCFGASLITSSSSCLKNFGIEQRVVHEEFSWSEQVNDIALLKLDGIVNSKGPIEPVCLPISSALNDFYAVPEVTFMAYGWGTTELRVHSRTLQMIIVKETPCAYDTDGMYFCTSSHIVDSCQGDSGGPLVVDRTQFGIIAHGRYPGACGVAGGAFNTNVSYFMPWIVDKLSIHW
ncbi:serine protease grass-like [Drosophila eugracilis]|uniref:serine protease grass-like n=1 Tax=Drosophila eugracilis TaxID=29029 RepID=UPI001BDB07EB|nr:serine protease grass-like [Drosophila eugracilis]